MEPLYRIEAHFTSLTVVGALPDGLRLDAHFEGRVVDGEFEGATVRGSDYLRFRPDGIGVLDVREILERDGDRIDVHAGGYLVPPDGFVMPPPEVISAPGFTWPEIDMPMHGFVTFATATPDWNELNRTVATFSGSANPGAGTIVVEAAAVVPEAVGV
jgi:hypothetical protein